MPPNLGDILARAWDRRAAMNLGDTNAFRVLDGSADGWLGVTIDNFAGHWLCSSATGNSREETLIKAAFSLPCRSLWWKRLDQREKEAPRWLSGDKPVAPFLIRERGVQFEVDFTAGYSQGIFLDQRSNRQRLRELSRLGDRVLNCFSYTCAFSVVAAAAGAVTTSLDLSGRYLEWGKRNFLANNLDPSEHFFCRGDVLTWLRQFAKKGRRFRGIILDPPTFSRSPAGVFRVGEDFGRLVKAALSALEPDGWLLCCANDRLTSLERFTRVIRDAISGATASLRSASMPDDFWDEPYLKSVWVNLAGTKLQNAPSLREPSRKERLSGNDEI